MKDNNAKKMLNDNDTTNLKVNAAVEVDSVSESLSGSLSGAVSGSVSAGVLSEDTSKAGLVAGSDSIQGLPLVLGNAPKILILGSMPSVRSLDVGQYYAHPQNAFWKIMQKLLNVSPSADYAARKKMLVAAGVGLWDVLAICQRCGSLDSSIVKESEVANDIARLLSHVPSIAAVALNGGKAQQCFKRHIDLNALPSSLEILCLPSTSAANARMNFDEKLLAWKKIMPFLSDS